jgi:hypothetical protein
MNGQRAGSWFRADALMCDAARRKRNASSAIAATIALIALPTVTGQANCLSVRAAIIDKSLTAISEICIAEAKLDMDMAKAERALANWIDTGGGGKDIRFACSLSCRSGETQSLCSQRFSEDLVGSVRRALRDRSYAGCKTHSR